MGAHTPLAILQHCPDSRAAQDIIAEMKRAATKENEVGRRNWGTTGGARMDEVAAMEAEVAAECIAGLLSDGEWRSSRELADMATRRGDDRGSQDVIHSLRWLMRRDRVERKPSECGYNRARWVWRLK